MPFQTEGICSLSLIFVPSIHLLNLIEFSCRNVLWLFQEDFFSDRRYSRNSYVMKAKGKNRRKEFIRKED